MYRVPYPVGVCGTGRPVLACFSVSTPRGMTPLRIGITDRLTVRASGNDVVARICVTRILDAMYPPQMVEPVIAEVIAITGPVMSWSMRPLPESTRQYDIGHHAHDMGAWVPRQESM